MAQGAREPRQRRGENQPQPYSIEQATSDEAQLHTIAFNGLAFVTGDFGAATFLPPGKVCDFFGFQYMRDIDAGQKGHNPMFLNRVAGNVLRILDDQQKTKLIDLAKEQAPQFEQLAVMRWPLIRAFYQEANAQRPAGATGLDPAAVSAYVGEIFAFDARLSHRRAQVFGAIATTLTAQQKADLAKMKFGDFGTWPEVAEVRDLMPRGLPHMQNVAYMTYASEFFSWYAGSVEADTYFCPERHGTYFGGFYMKDMPAMGQRDFDISTSVTGDSGRTFLELLTPEQRQVVTSLIDQQRPELREIITVRRQISTKLRVFLDGQAPSEDEVVALGRRYGELDGQISCSYAKAFAAVNRTLSDPQRQALRKLRNLEGYSSAKAYIYSTPVQSEPQVDNTDRFFGAAARSSR